MALSEMWAVPLELGFSVIPVQAHGKRPVGPWEKRQHERAGPAAIEQWARQGYNVGIVTGAISGLGVLDLDGEAAVAAAEARGLPETIMVRTGRPGGLHVYFRHPGGVARNRADLLKAEGIPGVDFRGDGGFVVGPGSVHENGNVYRWETPPPLFELAEMPPWLAELVTEPPPADDGRVAHHEKPAAKVASLGGARDREWAKAALDGEIAAVRATKQGERNHQLNRSAFALGQLASLLDEVATKKALLAAALNIGLSEDEAIATIESGWSKGAAEPRSRPPSRQEAAAAPPAAKPRRRKQAGEGEPAGDRPELSEDWLAAQFSGRHPGLRYDHHVGNWFEYSGSCWRRDETRRVFHLARDAVRELSGGAAKLCTARTVTAVLTMAAAAPCHAVTSAAWDPDPNLLGVPEGTVDLRTGRIREARPEDMISKQAAVAPASGKPALWLAFLDEATGGDQELIGFLQRMCGYCLTGHTREHVLFFIYGDGGNGKSVFLNVLTGVLEGYATAASMATFTASSYDRHATEIASLAGARLVTASETEQGRAWAEEKVKSLTGGDRMRARFMRKDEFEFQPVLKLVIVGNHAPALHNVDAAMQRRIRIIPFVNKPARPDKDLPEKLRAEWGQILSWMIEGCLAWQRQGLGEPPAVDVATRDYFRDQDIMGRWLEDRCEVGAGRFEASGKLFADWKAWAERNGEAAGNSTTFGTALGRMGYQVSFKGPAAGRTRVRVGLALKRLPISEGGRW